MFLFTPELNTESGLHRIQLLDKNRSRKQVVFLLAHLSPRVLRTSSSLF